MPISTHEINLHGLSGAIFWCIISSVIFYVVAFATNGWEHHGGTWIGLWATCQTGSYAYGDAEWWHAVQAMITIGLILLLAGAIAIILYMFLHSMSVSKNSLIITFTALTFAATLFMVIGYIIYGAKHSSNFNWSFAFSIIGAILCFTAAVLSVVHMKKSNVI